MNSGCTHAGDVGRAAALWRTVDLSQGQLLLRVWWSDFIGEKAKAQLIRQAARRIGDLKRHRCFAPLRCAQHDCLGVSF